VPAKSELAILGRANSAVAKTPPEVSAPLDHLGDGAALGPLLFAKLVPFAVHTAVSIYEQRRDHLVNGDIVQQFEALNSDMRDFLRDLNLPGSLQALERPLGIPNTTNMHAEELRQAEAVASMERSFRELENLRADNIRQFKEGQALLQTEADEDARLRARYGTDRWTRPDGRSDPAGQALYAKATEIDGLLSHSGHSDSVVRAEFDANYDMLTLLSGPDRGLLDFIPSSRTVDLPDTLKSAIGQLRRVYNDVQRLESRRRKNIESVEDIRRRDDIKPEILKEASRLERTRPNVEVRPADFEDLFNQRLDKKYDEILDGIDKEKAEQDKILNEVRLANREFESQRRQMGSSTGGKKREEAIQRLENAFEAYKEVRHNLGAARKFYNDLLKVTGNGFVAHIRPWMDARLNEAREHEEELNLPVLSRLSLGPQHNNMPERNTPQHDFPQHHMPHHDVSLANAPQHMSTQHVRYDSQQHQIQTQPMPGSNHFQPPAPTPLHTPYEQQSLDSTPKPTPQSMPAAAAAAQSQPQPQSHLAAQAHIQSWVGGIPSPSPQPAQFTQQGQVPGQAAAMWTPDMGIRFAAPAARSGQEHQSAAPGNQHQHQHQAHAHTWDPSGGIRFA
jgi:programmed cell death 6-interacting protein